MVGTQHTSLQAGEPCPTMGREHGRVDFQALPRSGNTPPDEGQAVTGLPRSKEKIRQNIQAPFDGSP